MKNVIAAGVVAFAAALGMAADSANAGCVLAGGEAVMVTEDLAKFMANAALKHSIENHGWTAHGAVKVKCEVTSIGLRRCMARQKACR